MFTSASLAKRNLMLLSSTGFPTKGYGTAATGLMKTKTQTKAKTQMKRKAENDGCFGYLQGKKP